MTDTAPTRSTADLDRDAAARRLDRWMAGGVVENDAEEARSLRLKPDRPDWDHPPQCRCRQCIVDYHYTPGDGDY